jgi:triphosphatase
MHILPIKIYKEQLRAIRDNSKKVSSAEGPKPLHDLRVAVLRLEWALKLFPEHLPVAQGIKDKLKSARRKMGDVRDLDVLLSTVDVSLNDPPIIKKIKAKQSDKRRRLIRHLKSPSYRRLLKRLGELPLKAEPLKNSMLSRKFLSCLKGVFKRKNRLAHPDDFHKLRKAFKKLRYTAEFFHPAVKKLDKLQDASVKFQDILGKRQDAVSAIGAVSSVSSKDPTEVNNFIRAQKCLIKGAEKKCKAKWKKDFVAPFSSYLHPSFISCLLS